MIDRQFQKTLYAHCNNEKVTRVANIGYSQGVSVPQIDISFVDTDSAIILSQHTYLMYRTKFYVESDNPQNYPVYIHSITEKFVILHIWDFSQDNVCNGVMGYRMSHENFVLNVSEQSNIVTIKIPGFDKVQDAKT